MRKRSLWVAVLAGLLMGSLFAESERPFKVANTIRFGYSDNLYRNQDEKESVFWSDVVDLSFRAALSDRTDLIAKSQITLLDDDGGTDLYPNLYLMLGHSVSPRLLLRLSEYYRSGDKSGDDVTSAEDDNERYNYFINRVEFSADYVLTDKDRLESSVNHEILRHDSEIDRLDYTSIGGGVTWKHILSPQRTYSTLNLRQKRVSYDNRADDFVRYDGVIFDYFDDEAYEDSTDITAGLNHTFNPQWQGSFEVGATYRQPEFPDYQTTDGTNVTVKRMENKDDWTPLIKAGLVYTPSPRTRLSADVLMRSEPTSSDERNSQDTAEIIFGAQHELTAKLTAKASARFARTDVDQNDDNDTVSGNQSLGDEERMDLEFRLIYQLNRMHFLEAGVSHSEKDYSDGEGWEDNRVDVGWRVEFN
jgi:hypothetical protein